MNMTIINWLGGSGNDWLDHWLFWAPFLMWAAVVVVGLLAIFYQRARLRSDAMLLAAGAINQLTLSSISDGVIHTDAAGTIIFCNAAAAKIVGTSVRNLMGRPFKSAVPVYKGEAQTLVENPMDFLLAAEGGVYLDPYSGLRTINGDIRPISETMSPVRDANGKIVGAVVVFQDVSDARDLNNQLRYQARHDLLTGLPNRLAFEESLQEFVSDARSRRESAFLMYLDLDHFKMINDVYGHIVGDRFLIEVSALLRTLIRADDGLARLGGDEFAITLRLADAEKAQQVADSLIAAVGAYRLDLGHRQCEVGLSIGIVSVTADDCDTSVLMARADTACYAAKDCGRGRCQLYLEDDAPILLAELTLSSADLIQRAFDDNRFEVYLQEIVGRNREVLGYESLIRMRSETGEVIMPDAFMPAAKRMGWMMRIDQWMLQQVLALARDWPAAKKQQPYISLNLSARSIGDAAFGDGMLALLDANGVDKRILRFEITETDQLQASLTEKRLINELHHRGFSVWLDDIGTGYNSFDILKRLEIDGIKIDRSFTRELVINPVDRALTQALVSIGKAMRLEIVAEGIEDEETYQALLGMHADAFQGHRFHKAESAACVMLNHSALAV